MTISAGRARRAQRIMSAHGLPGSPSAEPAVPGVDNEVTIVGPVGERYVVRWPRNQTHESFAAEVWAADRARACGVPTVEVVASGHLDEVAYSVHRYVAGRPGESVRSPDLWRTLGQYAATIAAVPLDGAPEALFSRFGRDLPAAWQEHLAYNLHALDAADPLLELGVFTRAEQSRVQAVVEDLRAVPIQQGLLHCDLALRNVVVPDDGPAVLLDWGSATTGPVPGTDLLHLLRSCESGGGPTEGETEAFAEGYGVDLPSLRPLLASLRLLAAVDLVRWARDRRPDLLDSTVAAARAQVRRSALTCDKP